MFQLFFLLESLASECMSDIRTCARSFTDVYGRKYLVTDYHNVGHSLASIALADIALL